MFLVQCVQFHAFKASFRLRGSPYWSHYATPGLVITSRAVVQREQSVGGGHQPHDLLELQVRYKITFRHGN